MKTSAKIQRWAEQARALGLVVEITEESGNDVVQSISMTVTRPQVNPVVTMLDVVRNADRISIHSVRTFNSGAWSHSAWRASYSGHSKFENLKIVQYAIQGMGE